MMNVVPQVALLLFYGAFVVVSVHYVFISLWCLQIQQLLD